MLSKINNWLDRRFQSEPDNLERLDELIKRLELGRIIFLGGVILLLVISTIESFLLEDSATKLESKFSLVLFMVVYVTIDIHTKLYKMQRNRLKKQ